MTLSKVQLKKEQNTNKEKRKNKQIKNYKNPYGLNNSKKLLLLLLLIITFIIYIPVFNNNFINQWDDEAYITGNPHIQLSIANIE